MEPDTELLRRYADRGAEEAFATLVERRIDFVYATALRRLDGAAHRAEEVAQTVFIQLARHAGSLGRRDDLLGWLFIATHHAAAHLKRTEARRQARELEAHSIQLTSSDLPANATWEQLRPVLDDAMLDLGEPDRRAILMRFFENARFAQLGATLGLTEDAARMRVERALEKLRAELKRRGIASTSAALGSVLAQHVTLVAPAGLATTVTTAALAGASGGAVAAAAGFLMSTKHVVTLAANVTVAGVAAFQLQRQSTASTEVAVVRPENETAAKPAQAQPASTATAPPSPTATTASPAAVVPKTATIDGRELTLQRAPRSAPIAPSAPLQLALNDVLGPNNSYRDDAFGLAVTFPEGWAVASAIRWGDGHRHHTAFFVPAAAPSVSSSMYYKLYHGDEVGQRAGAPAALLHEAAAKKEASRVGAFPDYKNVPESFSFEPVNGAPAMSYFATFTKDDQVMTEYFVRILGPRGYVMFFTTGRLGDVQPAMPQIQQMAKSVRIP